MVELFIQRFTIIILFLYKIYPKDEMNLIQNNFYAVYIKINKEELTIKFVQIYRIEIETIVKDLYINIYYGDDYQIRIDYLKRLYLDLKNKLQI